MSLLCGLFQLKVQSDIILTVKMFLVNHKENEIFSRTTAGAMGSAVASQHEGSGFDSQYNEGHLCVDLSACFSVSSCSIVHIRRHTACQFRGT